MNRRRSGSLYGMDNAAFEPEVVDVDEVASAVIAGVVPVAELANFFDTSFGVLAATIAEQGRNITGPAYARFHGPPTDTANLEVGFPTDRAIEAAGDVKPGSLPSGTVARAVHTGSYDELGASWGQLGAWISSQRLVPGEAMWEVYVTEPSPDMDPSDLRTELNWPVRAGS